MSRVGQIYRRAKRRKARKADYTLKYARVRQAAKADVLEGSSVGKTIVRLRKLYSACEMELPAQLKREVKRIANAATAKATVDAAGHPSGANTPTACGAPVTPVKEHEDRPVTATPPPKARAEAAAGGSGSTQPEAAPLQLSDPPTLRELLDCQAAMGFGTHAQDADLCWEERQAYAATMPYGRHMGKPLKDINSDGYYTDYIAEQNDYWDPSDEKVQLLINLQLVGAVRVDTKCVYKCMGVKYAMKQRLGVRWRGSPSPGACGSPSSGGDGIRGNTATSSSQRRVEVARRLAIAVVNQQDYTDDVPAPPGEPTVRFGRYKGWTVGQVLTGWVKGVCTQPGFRDRNEELVQQLVSRGRLIMAADGRRLIATEKRPTRRPARLYEEFVSRG